jgi:2-oxoglutarate ferredoxin oxidoreductase subunit alpha
MGIPVSPRNIFPPTSRGLPTWYEGARDREGPPRPARRRGPDGRHEPADLGAGHEGDRARRLRFYDNTKPLPPSKFRDDINVVGMPLTEISNSAYSVPRERQLFKNIICLGALAGIMDIEPGLIAELFGEQYKGKEKLLKPNLNALQLGLNYAKEFLKDSIGLKCKRAYAVGDQIFMEGNAAAALGLVYGGATVCAWYPITPSSSLAEALRTIVPN